MEWPKLKNIIILILLLVNGFLLVLVNDRRSEARRYEREALEHTVQVLEGQGIHVELSAVSPADGLAPMTAARDLDREARLARAVLGEETAAENRGGGLYLYRGELGEVSLRAGGGFSAELAEDERWHTDHPEAHAAGLLRKMGVDAVQTGMTVQGEGALVRFRQLWEGAPVFSCEVEFVYRGGALRSVRGSLLIAGEAVPEPGDVMTLPTALMRFLDGVTDAGDVCTVIHSMEAGYRAVSQPLSGGVRLTAVWLVSSNTAGYYLDGATGTLTRLTG